MKCVMVRALDIATHLIDVLVMRGRAGAPDFLGRQSRAIRPKLDVISIGPPALDYKDILVKADQCSRQGLKQVRAVLVRFLELSAKVLRSFEITKRRGRRSINMCCSLMTPTRTKGQFFAKPWP
jgi:hypothetical protein